MTADSAVKLGFILTATDKMSAVINNSVKKSLSKVGLFEQNFAKIGKSAMMVGTRALAGATAIGTALYGVAKNAADTGDSAIKTAQKIGMNVEAWQELAYAGKHAGVESDALASSMIKFNKTIMAAYKGDKAAVEAFKDLGVSIKDAQGKMRPPQDIIKDVAGFYSKVEDGAKKTTNAMALFGKSGADIIPLLNGGKANMEEFAVEARRLGLVLDEDACKSSEDFIKSVTTLKASVQGLGMNIGAALVPKIDKLVQKITETVGKVMKWVKEHRPLVDSIINICGKVAKYSLIIGTASMVFGGFTAVVLKGVRIIRGIGNVISSTTGFILDLKHILIINELIHPIENWYQNGEKKGAFAQICAKV